ncbi:MAG: glycosyltransferase family 2 protein [Bacteroidales bacterium]|nr:glycosyltransferase family 2 protein [Bacteroidales bacterium]
MEQPLVSILMTAYNREKYIAEAIESVLASTYQNWELIIVDDGSKDNTVEIARAYEAKDERINVYINEKNLGDYPNRNKAASYAKGKYIKYLDSDDIIYSHGLGVMVEAMERFPEAGIGFSYFNYESFERLPFLWSSEKSYKTHYFKKGIFIMGPSASIYNKEYFVDIGKFEEYGVASDYEFNLRAGAKKPVVLFQNDLIWWRRHEGQEIITSNKQNEYIKFNYLINKKLLLEAPLEAKVRNKALTNNEIQMGRKLLKYFFKLNFADFFSIIKFTKYPYNKLIRSLYFSKRI